MKKHAKKLVTTQSLIMPATSLLLLLLLVFYIEGFLCVFTYPRNLINVKVKSGGIRLEELKHSILAIRQAKGYQLQRQVRADRQNFKQSLLP